MLLTGVTKGMVDKALREQSLLKPEYWPPNGAIEEVTRALHEHSCAEWDIGMDEQKAWDELPVGAKQMGLTNATWLVGRLAHAGYRVVKLR